MAIKEDRRAAISDRLNLSMAGAVREFGIHPVNQNPAVVWDGCVFGYSGYAKANRELLHRVSNSMAVEMRPAFETSLDVHQRARLEPYLRIKAANGCPYIRFFGPDRTTYESRPRIIYTMMETSKIQADMMGLVNQGFDELWVPTTWNLHTFKTSGLKIPAKVMPLGVDPAIYHPGRRDKELPVCQLISTRRRGLEERPEGFIVLTVGVPSHRKGFDILANAFEKAFARKRDAHLIVATTHSTSNVPELQALEKYKSNIWAMTGALDEHGMARLYNSVDCYASASRGEGWNLPAIEAAACGVPVVLSDSSTHREISFGGCAFVFSNEGLERLPGIERISPWYKNMYFTKLGKRSISELAELLLFVEKGGPAVKSRAAKFLEYTVRDWSWDRTAAKISRRLMELQP